MRIEEESKVSQKSSQKLVLFKSEAKKTEKIMLDNAQKRSYSFRGRNEVLEKPKKNLNLKSMAFKSNLKKPLVEEESMRLPQKFEMNEVKSESIESEMVDK